MRSWLTGILTGLLYGVLFALATHYLAHASWTAALIAGVVTGPLFGASMAIVQARVERGLSSFPGDLTKSQCKAAARASRRGPIPTDPAIRAAALHLAHRQLERYQSRWMRVLMIAGPLLLVSSAVLVLLDDDQPWWRALPQLLGAAAFAVIAAESRSLRRRIALLSAPASDRAQL